MLEIYIDLGTLIGLIISSIVIMQMSFLLSAKKNLNVTNIAIPAIVTFTLTLVFWPLVLTRLMSDSQSVTKASKAFAKTVNQHKENNNG